MILGVELFNILISIIICSITEALDLLFLLAKDGNTGWSPEVFNNRIRDSAYAAYLALRELDETSPRVYAVLSSMLSADILDARTAVSFGRGDLKRSANTFSLLSLNHQVSHFRC